MDSLYIVMPAYNEEANIENVVRSWYTVLDGKDEKSRIVVADSGSKDNTHEILVNLQRELPQLELLQTTNQYHGPKLITLYDYAIKNGADYVFQTDSDGQTNPAEFGDMWEIRNKYEGVFGNRTARGDGKGRAFVERVVCGLLKMYFGVNVPDANAPFRLLHCSTLKKYLYKLPNDYELPNIMITTYFAYYHEKMIFLEISFKPREKGVNSINIKKIIGIGWKALGDFNRFKGRM